MGGGIPSASSDAPPHALPPRADIASAPGVGIGWSAWPEALGLDAREMPVQCSAAAAMVDARPRVGTGLARQHAWPPSRCSGPCHVGVLVPNAPSQARMRILQAQVERGGGSFAGVVFLRPATLPHSISNILQCQSPLFPISAPRAGIDIRTDRRLRPACDGWRAWTMVRTRYSSRWSSPASARRPRTAMACLRSRVRARATARRSSCIHLPRGHHASL